MYAVYFCVESNYCTKYFMRGFALQYKYANECKSGPQKCRVSYTKPCSTCKVHCLKTIYIADIITFKLPPSIYNIRISQDNYWP